MSSHARQRSSVLAGIFISAVALAAAVVFISFSIPRVIVLSVNTLTEYRVSYIRWRGNPLARSTVMGLKVGMKGKDLAVSAGRGDIDIDLALLLKERTLRLGCDMKDVVLSPTGSGTDLITGEDSVLSEVFKAGQRYDDVSFTLLMDAGMVKIEKFSARSRDIRLEGDYTLQKDKDVITLDLKLSFSPEMSGKLTEEIRENVLSPDEGGWYSTVINYKGNPLFLKALYSIAF